MSLFVPYGTLATRRRVLLFVLLSLLVITLSFIFYNSLLPPEKSAEESDAVGELVESVLPSGTPVTDFLVANIRPTAHFLEFFALGAVTALLLVFFSYRPLVLSLLSVCIGALTGLIDESLQSFSSRAPEVVDVWVDTLGYFCATVAVVSVYFITRLVRARLKKGN